MDFNFYLKIILWRSKTQQADNKQCMCGLQVNYEVSLSKKNIWEITKARNEHFTNSPYIGLYTEYGQVSKWKGLRIMSVLRPEWSVNVDGEEISNLCNSGSRDALLYGVSIERSTTYRRLR